MILVSLHSIMFVYFLIITGEAFILGFGAISYVLCSRDKGGVFYKGELIHFLSDGACISRKDFYFTSRYNGKMI